MLNKRRTIALFIWIITLTGVHANSFESTNSYQVYFTPGHDCTREIERAIGHARQSIYVQAYFLTSEPIISALVEAKSKQVDINVILDKRHPENQKAIKQLLQAQVPVWIDQASGIAHNKVMIIDEQEVITGSFNFTYSANHRNRENVLLIKDRGIAKHYLQNWHYCKRKAVQEKPLRRKQSKTVISHRIHDHLTRLITLVILGIASALGIRLE